MIRNISIEELDFNTIHSFHNINKIFSFYSFQMVSKGWAQSGHGALRHCGIDNLQVTGKEIIKTKASMRHEFRTQLIQI